MEKRNLDTKAYSIEINFDSSFKVKSPTSITLIEALKYYEAFTKMNDIFKFKSLLIIDAETGEIIMEFGDMNLTDGQIIKTTIYNRINSHLLEWY